jgi:DNA-binding SARP family transcriptional activator/tetratricopeptide (TPR) repeat protein
VEFRVLGSMEVVVHGRRIHLPTGRGRALLAMLVIRAGEVLPSDHLIDQLWGEAPPPTVDTALQGLVSKLRGRLEPDRAPGAPPTLLVTRPPGYVLAINPGQVDANRFRRLVAQAEALPADQAGAALARALALWRGPALAEVRYEPFAQAEIAALEELRLHATEKRIEADLALGRHAGLIGELQALVSDHPLRERLREQLMLALYRSGRQAEALDAFVDARRTMVDELGIEPGPALQRLQHMILIQDPSLAATTGLGVSAPVDDAGWLADERRSVTVLSLDVVASGEQAARRARALQERAAEGEILVARTTGLLIGTAALLQPTEITAAGATETAWKLVDLALGPPALTLTGEPPIVGRSEELARLRAGYERALEERAAVRCTVVGEAGIGKSRLARELAARLQSEATVMTTHCPAYGDGITFWPLRELVMSAVRSAGARTVSDLLAGDEGAETTAAGVASAIGAAEPDAVGGPLFLTLRRFFEILARRGPLVVVVEDLHWAQPTFLDLVEYIGDYADGPIFILCLTRPDLLEARPAWVDGPRATSLILGPLTPAEAGRLAGDRLAGRMVSPDVVSQILDAAQGNPLFVEQILAAVRDEGRLLVPASVRALLAARIDRLGPAERDLVRVASVLGRRFSVPALIALLPEAVRPHAGRHFRALERKELLAPATDESAEAELGFRHGLVQHAAYHSMTKRTRAELHERAAAWLERATPDANAGGDEMVGHHLERAYDHRRELGDTGAHALELRHRAGEYLATAGLRAFGRFDAAGAENLLGRARRLLPIDHPAHREVSYRLAEAHETMGRHVEADRVLVDLLVEPPADPAARAVLELEQARIRLAVGPDPISLEVIAERASAVLAVHEATGNDVGAAQALFIHAEIFLRTGRIAEMEAAARRGLAHADRSGSAREQLGARRMLATALEAGPVPLDRCLPECEALARWRGGENPAALPVLALLRAMAGEFDASRELIVRAEVLLRERTRARRPLGLLWKRHAEIEMLAGDHEAAERRLRRALQLDIDMGVREEAAEAAALLARTLALHGAADEAAAMAELSEAQAPAESVTPQALWRSSRAVVMAASGEVEPAVALAREAASLVPDDMLRLRADVHVELARTLVAAGDRDGARHALEEAIELHGRKGNRSGADQARQAPAVFVSATVHSRARGTSKSS